MKHQYEASMMNDEKILQRFQAAYFLRWQQKIVIQSPNKNA